MELLKLFQMTWMLCERERGREGERERERETETERQRETETERQRETERDGERERVGHFRVAAAEFLWGVGGGGNI